MRGRHQIKNAGLALAAAELLDGAGIAIREESVREGLKDVQWRGRQEWHPGPPQILLDGAHNPEAMRMLCRSLKREYEFERLRVLMGVMKEKDHSRMIRALGPMAHEFVFCRASMERSQDPWILQKEAERLGFRATIVGSVTEGFEALLKRAMREDLICITGSLFVVGEILAGFERKDLHLNRFLS
jgi:dihydrofolate synthase/folylpolyglutamate synthase